TPCIVVVERDGAGPQIEHGIGRRRARSARAGLKDCRHAGVGQALAEALGKACDVRVEPPPLSFAEGDRVDGTYSARARGQLVEQWNDRLLVRVSDVYSRISGPLERLQKQRKVIRAHVLSGEVEQLVFER